MRKLIQAMSLSVDSGYINWNLLFMLEDDDELKKEISFNSQF